MKRWFGPFVTLLIAAIAAHWATLHYAPSVIMDRALLALKDRGIAEHAFTTPERITPQTQAVVRSSPDLFYSLCRYDLSQEGAVLDVTVGEWPDYQSLSFFDEETNNFATIRATGGNAQTYLYFDDGEHNRPDSWIPSPTKRGLVLIRRLAPTQDTFRAAQKVSEADSCALKTP